jgi:hypothetical protein
MAAPLIRVASGGRGRAAHTDHIAAIFISTAHIIIVANCGGTHSGDSDHRTSGGKDRRSTASKIREAAVSAAAAPRIDFALNCCSKPTKIAADGASLLDEAGLDRSGSTGSTSASGGTTARGRGLLLGGSRTCGDRTVGG